MNTFLLAYALFILTFSIVGLVWNGEIVLSIFIKNKPFLVRSVWQNVHLGIIISFLFLQIIFFTGFKPLYLIVISIFGYVIASTMKRKALLIYGSTQEDLRLAVLYFLKKNAITHTEKLSSFELPDQNNQILVTSPSKWIGTIQLKKNTSEDRKLYMALDTDLRAYYSKSDITSSKAASLPLFAVSLLMVVMMLYGCWLLIISLFAF
jgi:hypothetical protein